MATKIKRFADFNCKQCGRTTMRSAPGQRFCAKCARARAQKKKRTNKTVLSTTEAQRRRELKKVRMELGQERAGDCVYLTATLYYPDRIFEFYRRPTERRDMASDKRALIDTMTFWCGLFGITLDILF